MATRIVSCLLLSVVLFAAAGVAVAGDPWSDLTVTQQDGWTHRHVTATVSDDGATLDLVREDGSRLALPVAEVAVIRDAGGRDITVEVLPARADRHRTLPTIPPDELTGGHRAERLAPEDMTGPGRYFRVALGGGAGFGITNGSYYAELDDGVSYHGDLRYGLSHRTYVKLAWRTNRLFETQIPAYEEGTEEYLGDIDVTVDLNQYLFMFGLMNSPDDTRTRSYLEVGFGWGDHVTTAELLGVSASEKVGRGLVATQVGMIVPLGGAGLAVEGAISYTLKLFGSGPDEGMGGVLGAQAGLVFLLGGGS
jgi:hypothetical protein